MTLFTNKLDILLAISHIFFLSVLQKSKLDSLLIEKILTLHNVIIYIKSVLNKDKNHYYYRMFLEECSY